MGLEQRHANLRAQRKAPARGCKLVAVEVLAVGHPVTLVLAAVVRRLSHKRPDSSVCGNGNNQRQDQQKAL